ncbi:MAG: hypothetical protein JNK88_04740 [Mangrovicoccus sp.]|nr:hypothetical protein [Mangrovicoccus sp.]
MRVIAALAIVLSTLLPALPAAAQTARGSDAILAAMQTEALLAVLQDEAVRAGEDLAETMMPGRPVAGWSQTVERINAPSRTGPILGRSFAEALESRHAGAILDYLEAPLGRRIVGLELSAREALRDPSVQDAVLADYDEMRREGDPRADQIDAFIKVNDLIDANVVGALNANAAFLKGMGAAASDDAADRLSEADILTQVWQQEPELRAETEDWVRAFVALAYQPLSDAELADYLAFTGTPAGQAMNRALFAAFDTLFVATSYQTGEALGRWIGSEDL